MHKPEAVSALFLLLAFCGAASAAPVEPMWTHVRPSTTGVPGEEVRLMAFDPQGNLWVGARWPFWGEGGLAMLSADQLPHTPLPGGGFDTGVWRVWSNVDHPLPSPYLMDIEFAPDGVIWLASDGGLTRFDPATKLPQVRWRTYNAANSPLILDAVHSLDLDSQGNLWLTNASGQSSNGAVFKFNPTTEQWTRYSVGSELPPGWSLPWKNVNAIMVGANDRVWVTHMTLGGMAEFDGVDWVLHETPSPLDDMLEDPQGDIWVGTSQDGLYKWDGLDWQHWPMVGGAVTMTGLGLDRDGVVYVSTWYGEIYRMIGGTPQFFVAADNIPRGVIGRPDGDIWINNYGGNGTLGTVRHYDSNGTLLERFNSYNTGLPDYFIERVQTDSQGNLWFAAGEGGLSRFDGARWRNWGSHNDGSEPYPWAGNEPMGGFYLDSQGVGWMGGNGIGRWGVQSGTFTGFWNWQNNPGMGVTLFTAFAEDATGKLFAASQDGLVYSFDNSLWVQEPLAQPPYTSTFAWLKADSAGVVYAALPLHLHRWDGVAWSEVPQPSPDFLFDLGGVNCMTIGPDDVMWIGTNRGLVRWDGSSFTVFDTANSPLPAREVQGVDVRRDGVIALSAHEFGSVTPFPNGVAYIDHDIANPASWTVWSYGTSPLPHYQLGAVKFDARGDLWVSAISEGMVRIRTGTDRRLVPQATDEQRSEPGCIGVACNRVSGTEDSAR